ncbi:YhcB family protein [Marinobacter xiaoshiensis]|uniref:Z-ring associated protein G n=1 Tax=Marinobacter xiaoshiensis TaxID=3073652 RepID=A0ABU2HEF1_9GAMM|nr:YhcB family protein [Marinobacter sp. F60267]MDS1309417.1 YhcB family protein [Marinobacter sp. F60267]
MTNLILAAIAALIVGIVIGAIFGRSGQGSTLRQRRAEQQTEEVRNEYTRYQAQVNEHFMESAHLLRRFNDAYRDVNQHMARGANRLCNDEEWMAELAEETSRKRLEEVSEDGAEPPRDYAPKTSGTLSEDFGLKKGGKSAEA